MKPTRYFDTFTGIGGFTLAIQNAHETYIKYAHVGKKSESEERTQGRKRSTDKRGILLHSGDRPAPLCIGYSEIDPYAIKIYQKHFPNHKNYGDITKINEKELPDFDLLVGGFPCQSFSIAGKRGGFNDTRGTLFFDIARIIKEKRPRILLLENVKGLLSHDEGRTFNTIISALDELGYDLQWQVLNSKDFGVPQNRERIYIVGHIRGTSRPQVFPFTENDIEDTRLQGHICNTLTTRYEKGQATGTYVVESKLDAQGIVQLNKPVHSNDRIYSPEGIGPTLNTMQGGRRQPFVALSRNGDNRSTSIDSIGVRTTPSISRSVDGISDSQRYKCCGNAVTTFVPQAILERIFLSLYENN